MPAIRWLGGDGQLRRRREIEMAASVISPATVGMKARCHGWRHDRNVANARAHHHLARPPTPAACIGVGLERVEAGQHGENIGKRARRQWPRSKRASCRRIENMAGLSCHRIVSPMRIAW